MPTTVTKRKRARKACIPCHQRKRKCDAEYPCSMCTTYQYICRYTDDITGAAESSIDTSSQVKRSKLSGASSSISQTTNFETPATVSTTCTTPSGIFDKQKSRYAGASSTMAFPHVLGLALGSDSPPKMRSFAYNFGVRPEEPSNPHGLLGSIISEHDLALFSDVFFSEMAPIADYLDPEIYAQQCREYYHGSGNKAIVFGAVAASVAALGSFLSADKRYLRESELVQYTKAILDDPASMRIPSIAHIIALAMRTFYLRATTRPNHAWIASCTAMHLFEVIGLHEEENIDKLASVAGADIIGHDADRLRRIFWISWAGHNILSYEIDRSAVQFRSVTCRNMVSKPGSVADQFVQIAQIMPAPNSPFHLESQPLTEREELFERLKALDKLQVVHPFLVITKADVAFCFYRHLYQLKAGISDNMAQLIIDSGNAAIKAAQQLAEGGRLFWNVIGSVFQYICILLAINTPTASAQIATAFKTLENLVQTADTGITREALSMARHLLNLTMTKKRIELAQLEAIDQSSQLSSAQQESESNNPVQNLDWEMDWDQFFFEPYLWMLGSDE